MGGLFDEIREELRRRQAAARGDAPRSADGDDGPADDAGADPDAAIDGDDEPDTDGARSDDADDPERPDGERRRSPPRPIFARSRTGGPGRPGGPGRRRTARSPDDASPPGRGFGLRGSALISVVVFLVFLVVLFGRGLVELWTDVLWYDSVGFDQVIWTRLGAQVGLFVVGAVLSLVVLLGNLWLAGRMARPPADGSGGPLRSWIERLTEAAQAAERGMDGGGFEGLGRRGPRPVGPPEEQLEIPDLVPIGRWVLVAFAVLTLLGAAGGLSTAWETVLLWQNRVPFSADGSVVADPVFGRDIGFFFFELPFLRLVQVLIVGLLVSSLLIVVGRYLLAALGRGLAITTGVRLHLGLLAGLFLLAIAFGYQLDKLELAYSTRGVGGVVGVSYTDSNAQFFAYDLLTIVSGLAAAFLVGGAFTRWLWPLGATLVVWFVASLVVGRLYPEAIQRLVVLPNQFAQERPFIQNNISMTRLAFGFDNPDGSERWDDSRRYEGTSPLTAEAIDNEQATFENARLWDYRPLGATLDQLQTIRRYYDFVDVDTDRYEIGDRVRQVMLSARELDVGGTGTAGFVNTRVIFTHGIGVAMVPVNEVASEGQPRLFIGDVPPVSVPDAPQITEPRIYFGERPSGYVVTNARQPEFDYPRGEAEPGTTDTDVEETRWQGRTGIPLGTNLNRLLFALRFGDLDLLISDQVTSESQLLFNRAISDRVPRIAPFLQFDKDPYVVINEAGRLVYLQDAYTTTDRFPHANPFSPADLPYQNSGFTSGPFNYARNSVKISIDAYDGTMTFYVADPADPLIRAWQNVFPGIFRPMTDMPADLAGHIRVAEEGFNVQSRMYGRYHVIDPLRFFQQDDLWTVPASQRAEQTLPSEAYYVIMRMPGEAESEFLLLQPMVPRERPNMIAWVAARNDQPDYGQVRVYTFPVNTTVFGPAQIEARIDQDPQISAQFTLWRNSGSNVIRGNLIVVPVGESLLYLQPVYLQSTASAVPEFQRIIVASATEIVWAPTLSESLQLLLEAQSGPGTSPSPTPPPTASPPPGTSPTPSVGPTGSPTPTASPGQLPTDIPGLIDFANEHYQLAEQALRDGNFAQYGEEIALVRQALQRLDELSGLSPSPAPNPAPAP